jgi:hypothetical protein
LSCLFLIFVFPNFVKFPNFFHFFHYIVLRLPIDSPLTLFDGTGVYIDAVLSHFGRDGTFVSPTSTLKVLEQFLEISSSLSSLIFHTHTHTHSTLVLSSTT